MSYHPRQYMFTENVKKKINQKIDPENHGDCDYSFQRFFLIICFSTGHINKKKHKRKEKRKNRSKGNANSTSDTCTESDGVTPSLIDKETRASFVTCHGTFKFFKVGKAAPSLQFTKIVCIDKEKSLSDICETLIQQHIASFELFKKLQAYDVNIHVCRQDKLYSAHTPEQWVQIRDLLTCGYS